MTRIKTVFQFSIFPFSVLLLLATVSLAADNAAVQERRRTYLLIRDLADKKPAVRDEAEGKLKEMGEKAVPELILALEGKHLAVSTMAADKQELARSRAARVLGAIGARLPVEPGGKDPPAQPKADLARKDIAAHLMAALGDKSVLVRRSAIGALGDLRWKDAAPELVKLTADGNAAIAGDAVLALGSLGDKSAVASLLEVLAARAPLKVRYNNDADAARVRAAAAFALGMLGDTAAVPQLLAALRDPDAPVRRHADLALRAMSGRDLGFKADAPEPDREKIVKAWEAWWEAKK